MFVNDAQDDTEPVHALRRVCKAWVGLFEGRDEALRAGWVRRSGRYVARCAVAHLRAEVLHGWIATMPGVTMPVHQLPFVVLTAVDLRDAEVYRLDRAAADVTGPRLVVHLL